MEIDGISVEKAIEEACKELNITREELKHDIISYGSSGIFGLVGTKKARIRVTVPDMEIKEEISQTKSNLFGEKISDLIVCNEKYENIYIEKGLEILHKILNTITDDAKTSVKITAS